MASFGGSWTFIISFGVFLFVWIVTNVTWLANRGFDPYPFILLNLILSRIAAMQAPVIMMSQNRQQDVIEVQKVQVQMIPTFSDAWANRLKM